MDDRSRDKPDRHEAENLAGDIIAHPTRPIGKLAAAFASISRRASSGMAARIGVSMIPGDTALMRTGASSSASASVTAGVPAVSERPATTTAMLATKGMDAVAVSRAATTLLGRIVIGQSTVIAFDTAFNAVALLFVIAAPVLVTIKIGLSRYAKMRVARLPQA
jgi:hypothetical protein